MNARTIIHKAMRAADPDGAQPCDIQYVTDPEKYINSQVSHQREIAFLARLQAIPQQVLEHSPRLSSGERAHFSRPGVFSAEDVHAIEAWMPSLIEAMRESLEPVDVNVTAIDASTTADLVEPNEPDMSEETPEPEVTSEVTV